MTGFTHMDTEARVRMVDVTAKEATDRTAVARGAIAMQPDTLEKNSGWCRNKGQCP